MTHGSPQITFSIRFTVLTLFIVMALLIAALALGSQYYFSNRLARTAAMSSFENTAQKVGERIKALDEQSAELVRMLGQFDLMHVPGGSADFVRGDSAALRSALAMPAAAMVQNRNIYAVYAGYANGDFLELINAQSSPAVRHAFNAGENDRWIVIAISSKNGRRLKTTSYLDAQLNNHKTDTTPAEYDPRERPWFTKAMANRIVVRTEPYIFANLGKPGVTYALQLPHSGGVAAVDLALAGLDNYLAEQRLLPDSEAFLFTGKGDVVASSAPMDGPARKAFEELAADPNNNQSVRTVEVAGKDHFAYVAPLPSVYGQQEYIGFLAPAWPALQPYLQQVRYSMIASTVALLLVTPLVWRLTHLIVRPVKALSQESEKVSQRRYDAVNTVPSRITEMAELSHSMVSMARSIKQYEEAQRELMDSFIKLIATAIDQKSPYTGGHCERVSRLAGMLAEAASDATEGPLAEFTFHNPDEWREFHIASWLHDCGKVTTPEFVVDKETRLEAKTNRIHEIRMRFEVLLRDAEIAYWRELVWGRSDPAKLEEELHAAQERIRDDFAFVASCNLGDVFVDEEKISRLQDIAQRTWTRCLDDRLGLSHLELQRYPEDAPAPPVEEHVLADKPEHVIPRPVAKQDILRDGFALEPPEHLYNMGELHNLSIPRGTLTPEDRYKINEHVISTIRMLETLPYPENLARIPEYAGAHHETLNGDGYPRRLTEEHISTPARILAIADVFEALTASDRPYKQPKKLSEAVQILHAMAQERHIDPELFKLFLTSGVYMNYAREFLAEDQIDYVEVSEFAWYL